MPLIPSPGDPVPYTGPITRSRAKILAEKGIVLDTPSVTPLVSSRVTPVVTPVVTPSVTPVVSSRVTSRRVVPAYRPGVKPSADEHFDCGVALSGCCMNVALCFLGISC